MARRPVNSVVMAHNYSLIADIVALTIALLALAMMKAEDECDA